MNTAILVLDIQKDFLANNARMPVAKHQSGSMLQQINRVIDDFHSAQLPIIYIGNEFERVQWISNLFRNHAAIKGSPGAKLDERLHVVNDMYFSKKVGSALTNRLLVEFLTKNRFRHLVIVGLFAEGCVSATAKHALKSGFEVTVLSDAVAGASDVKRDKALANLKSFGARIMTSQEFLDSFSHVSC